LDVCFEGGERESSPRPGERLSFCEVVFTIVFLGRPPGRFTSGDPNVVFAISGGYDNEGDADSFFSKQVISATFCALESFVISLKAMHKHPASRKQNARPDMDTYPIRDTPPGKNMKQGFAGGFSIKGGLPGLQKRLSGTTRLFFPQVPFSGPPRAPRIGLPILPLV